MSHISCHVNYINVKANVEKRDDEPTLVTLTFVTNVGDGYQYHVRSHVNLVNVNSNVGSRGVLKR